MEGYSAIPLPKKLGIQEKFRMTFAGLPADGCGASGATAADISG